MKNTKTCSKCNSKNIIRIPGKFGGFGSRVTIFRGEFQAMNADRFDVEEYYKCN
ncbi:hypothetical protein [Clostridium estertheticum]|uniref:hypothetical protein n=1 Tax=Clostridium estertheticum TaxID=238834 RepID=UPI001C0DF8B2|nr:hypothetical protein [Clostridium estertheticum]MBU3186202.1 hypothetical protein [Clostridium estertheticum]